MVSQKLKKGAVVTPQVTSRTWESPIDDECFPEEIYFLAKLTKNISR